MQQLPELPTTFYDLVEGDLRRAARLIIKIQDEIDWQLRIATPEGDYDLSVPIPDAADERSAMLGRLAVSLCESEPLPMCWRLKRERLTRSVQPAYRRASSITPERTSERAEVSSLVV